MMSNNFIFIVSMTLMVIIFYRMLTSRSIREKDAILWILVGTLCLMSLLFPELVIGLGSLFGFSLPANFLLVSSILVLFTIVLQLTVDVIKIEDQAQRLSEEVAILRYQFETRINATDENSNSK